MENQQGPAVQLRELCSIFCDNLMVTRGKDGGRDSQGVWDGHGHTAVFHMENLLHSTEKSAQCLKADWMGEEFGGQGIYVYGWLSPFTVLLKLLQHR